MKKSIIAIALFGMLTGNVNAQEAKAPKTADFQTEIENAIDECKDKATFMNFYSAIFGNNKKVVNAMSEVYDRIEASKAKGNKATLDDLRNILKQLEDAGVDQATIQEYTDKLLKLYIYHTGERETPYMANTAKFRIGELYSAPNDEIFYGIGSEKNVYNPLGISAREKEAAIENGARLKHNGSYAWGMVTYDKKLYWSTNNNYLCMQGYGNFAQPGKGDQAYENNCWACEYAQGKWGAENYGAANAKYGDVRPPRIFCYNPSTGFVNDITPSGAGFEPLQNCQGLRSAGAHNGVIFFGGPSLYNNEWDSNAAVSAFVAYDADKGEFISASDMGSVDGCGVADVRRWIVHNNILYVGVKLVKPDGTACGAVLRWYGDKKNPWNFHIVGLTKDEAAEICIFNDRIYAGTWGSMSQVCKGPVVPADGLQPVSLDSEYWPQVWSTGDYERSATIGRSITAVAGFRTWRNHLYWGVFCPNFYVPAITMQYYGTNLTSADALQFMLANYRTASFWRVDANDNVDLLYGETEHPKLKTSGVTGEKTVLFEKNGLTPKFGRAGFGNLWDFYVWALYVYKDNLYIGTMDGSNLIGAVKDSENPGAYDIIGSLFNADEDEYGFELLQMTDEEKAPRFITRTGFNNGDAYGIRNFEILNDKLYVGTASPFNLADQGGWHIYSLVDKNATGIEETENTIAPSVYLQNENGSITVTTVGGEDIESVEVFDMAGKMLYKGTPAKHEVSVSSEAFPEAVIIKVTSSKGSWSTKVLKK